MAKNWNTPVQSPTYEAIENIQARVTNERQDRMLARIGRLMTIRAEILVEVSSKNTNDVNQHLQSAMENIDFAITEIQVTEQRLKGE